MNYHGKSHNNQKQEARYGGKYNLQYICRLFGNCIQFKKKDHKLELIEAHDCIHNNMEKTHQFIWDTLQDYDKIEWQQTLSDLEKASDVTFQDVFNEFDLIWGVKGLIVTWSNLVVT